MLSQATTNLEEADLSLADLNQAIINLSEKYYALEDQIRPENGDCDPLLIEIVTKLNDFFKSLDSIKNLIKDIEVDRKYKEQKYAEDARAYLLAENTIKEFDAIQKKYKLLSNDHQELKDKYRELFYAHEELKEALEELNNKSLSQKTITEKPKEEEEKSIAVNATEADSEELKAELARLRKQVKKQEEEIEALSQKNLDSTEENEKLQRGFAALKSNYDSLQQKNLELSIKLEEQAQQNEEKEVGKVIESFADEMKKLQTPSTVNLGKTENKEEDEVEERTSLRDDVSTFNAYNAGKLGQLRTHIRIMSVEESETNQTQAFVSALTALYLLIEEISKTKETNRYVINQQEKILSTAIQMLEIVNQYPNPVEVTAENFKKATASFQTNCNDVIHPKEPTSTFTKRVLSTFRLFHEEKVDPKLLKEVQDKFEQPTKAIYEEAEKYTTRHFTK